MWLSAGENRGNLYSRTKCLQIRLIPCIYNLRQLLVDAKNHLEDEDLQDEALQGEDLQDEEEDADVDLSEEKDEAQFGRESLYCSFPPRNEHFRNRGVTNRSSAVVLLLFLWLLLLAYDGERHSMRETFNRNDFR